MSTQEVEAVLKERYLGMCSLRIRFGRAYAIFPDGREQEVESKRIVEMWITGMERAKKKGKDGIR